MLNRLGCSLVTQEGWRAVAAGGWPCAFLIDARRLRLVYC